MIDRSLNHPSLSGADYVLEGATIRDRFLTAFVLQHQGALEIAWPQATRMPDPPASFGLGMPLPSAEEETFQVHVESDYEPLTVQVIDGWFGADDDDGEL